MPISAIFCNSSMFIVPGIFSTVNLIPFFITPSAPITTGSVVVFIFHILLTSIIIIIIMLKVVVHFMGKDQQSRASRFAFYCESTPVSIV